MEPDREDSLETLTDTAVIWRFEPEPARTRELIDAAVEALVRGLDSPSLRELAGTDPSESSFAVKPVLERTLDELGVETTPPADLETAILEAQCRRLFAGRIEERQLAAWCHRNIGHEGPARLRSLVYLDDIYDMTEYDDRSLAGVDEWVRREARSLLEGTDSLLFTDSPWADQLVVDPPTAPVKSWVRRIVNRGI